ncbi:Leucine_rich repeats-containing protein [Hexamita inflata]|uniref:Leucine rich repeats-containing protein n=1 Tax=Hexamita inflata TaxID=28002 RepID=A0AA86UL81_9EUKA|nr:Leucine rich repeats-containing protein [Hexamita inflata]
MTAKNSDNFLKITGVQQLLDPGIQKQEKIWIENILHTKIDLVPVNVKHLTIRSCNLLSLKGLVNVGCLEYLDVSGNPVYSMREIVVHKQLKTLILQNTQIIEVSQVSQLLSLAEFDATNSYIVDSLPLIDHPNFDVKWLTPQQIPALPVFEMYLHLLNDSGEAQSLMTLEFAKNPESDYMVKMAKRYTSQVKSGKLVVDNDQEITHFRFTDCIRATISCFNKCFKINFESTPKNLKELSITNSKLTSVQGVQKMTKLELVDFTNNSLIFIDPIKTLTGLKQVFVDGNHLHDLIIIKNLPNFQGNAVQMQTAPTNEIYKNCLGSEFSEAKVNELLVLFKKNHIFDSQFAHDTNMATHFKQFIVNKTLKICGHDDLKSIKFTDYLDVEELNLQNCYEVTLERTPKNIKKLIMNNCLLNTSRINGLENMSQVTELNLGLNMLTDDCLEIIGSMNNLQCLDLSINRLENVDKLKQLGNLRALDLNQNFIKTVDCLESLARLQNLDISYNQVSQVKALENMENMKVLNISHNKINSMQCLAKMKNIVSLDISFNQIISVEICKDFKMLNDLRTQKNKIQDFSTIMSHQNCTQTWQSEQNQMDDQDYTNAGLTTRQITNLKMGQKYNQNNNKMLKKYQDKVVNSELTINNDNEVMNLLFSDVHKVKKITADNCQNVVFDMAPVYVQVLAVRNSKLTHITNIYQMEQLTDLDLSGNAIRDISELAVLVNLVRLNLSSNDIYRIDSLKELSKEQNKLQYLNLSNNKILFCEPLKDLSITDLQINQNLINDFIYIQQMKNFKIQFIGEYAPHHKQTVTDFQNYLGENFGTAEEAQKLMKLQTENKLKQLEIIHYYGIFFRNQSNSSGDEFVIENEEKLTNIECTDWLNVRKLTVRKCNNLKFERVPKNITHLTVNYCQLHHVNGIEQMKQLTALNLNNNKLLFVNPILAPLTNLQQFSAEQNFITDFPSIKSLPNFNYSFVSPQNTPNTQDLENYLRSTNSSTTVQQLQTLIQSNKQANDEIINEYHNKMVQKYNNAVQNGSLMIQNDPELRDFEFADSLNVTQLFIEKCLNVQFQRTPKKVLKLYVRECELKRINGVEKMELNYLDLYDNLINNVEPLRGMTGLQTLSLYYNKVVSVEPLRGLTGLTYLILSNNLVQDFSPVNSHPNINRGDYYLDSQSTPSAQEIANSK